MSQSAQTWIVKASYTDVPPSSQAPADDRKPKQRNRRKNSAGSSADQHRGSTSRDIPVASDKSSMLSARATAFVPSPQASEEISLRPQTASRPSESGGRKSHNNRRKPRGPNRESAMEERKEEEGDVHGETIVYDGGSRQHQDQTTGTSNARPTSVNTSASRLPPAESQERPPRNKRPPKQHPNSRHNTTTTPLSTSANTASTDSVVGTSRAPAAVMPTGRAKGTDTGGGTRKSKRAQLVTNSTTDSVRDSYASTRMSALAVAQANPKLLVEPRPDRQQRKEGGRRDGRHAGLNSDTRHHSSTQNNNEQNSDDEEERDQETVTELCERLTKKLRNNRYECMICMNNLGKKGEIWSCDHCWNMFHLNCLSKWINKSGQESTHANLTWRCPGCQFVHSSDQLPTYKCFCGKMKCPSFNPYQVPHSCGETCLRSRGDGCTHPCSLSCHPGPCPPCSSLAPLTSCHCGNTNYRPRCGDPNPKRSCSQTCGRLLGCQLHLCENICHAGPCPPCPFTTTVTCFCGTVSKTAGCGSKPFSCAALCEKPLDCGRHACKKRCHQGPCDSCALTPERVTMCPCGSTPLDKLGSPPRQFCTDPIPLCSQVCNKLLACNIHRCLDKCHEGPCKPCGQLVKQKCRCGKDTRTVPCAVSTDNGPTGSVFLCDRVCKRKKSCMRHRCNTVCCTVGESRYDPEGVHLCIEPCGKMLDCGEHVCVLLCHLGYCGPCPVVSYDIQSCACGATTREPPIKCGTPPPECRRKCRQVRACGHTCTSNCHFGPCPLCTELTERMCVGGHEMRKNVPCHVKEVSCGKLCGKPMPCGTHHCLQKCHAGPCVPEAESIQSTDSTAEVSCRQSCDLPRRNCEHLCKAICHPGKDCPPVICKEKVRIRCRCGRRVHVAECGRGAVTEEVGRHTRDTLDCDDECVVQMRNKNLAEALGLDVKSHSVSSTADDRYSEELITMARQELVFVRNLELRLESIVKNRTPSLNMPPMVRNKRAIIHELAREHYGLDTQTFDEEPNRSVTVFYTKRGRVPCPLLSIVAASAASQNLPLKESAILHFYDLRPSDTNGALKEVLRPFTAPNEYRIRWADHCNAYVTFSDAAKAASVFQSLRNGVNQSQFTSLRLIRNPESKEEEEDRDNVPAAAASYASAIAAATSAGKPKEIPAESSASAWRKPVRKDAWGDDSDKTLQQAQAATEFKRAMSGGRFVALTRAASPANAATAAAGGSGLPHALQAAVPTLPAPSTAAVPAPVSMPVPVLHTATSTETVAPQVQDNVVDDWTILADSTDIPSSS